MGASPTATASSPASRSVGSRVRWRRCSPGERTALNFLCHLSGVATLTRRFVDAAAVGAGAARIVETRKTLPGLRALEKAAVRAGGGANHRGSLSDMVLVKDNHLAGLTIADAVEPGPGDAGRAAASRSSATGPSRSTRRSRPVPTS